MRRRNGNPQWALDMIGLHALTIVCLIIGGKSLAFVHSLTEDTPPHTMTEKDGEKQGINSTLRLRAITYDSGAATPLRSFRLNPSSNGTSGGTPSTSRNGRVVPLFIYCACRRWCLDSNSSGSKCPVPESCRPLLRCAAVVRNRPLPGTVPLFTPRRDNIPADAGAVPSHQLGRRNARGTPKRIPLRHKEA